MAVMTDSWSLAVALITLGYHTVEDELAYSQLLGPLIFMSSRLQSATVNNVQVRMVWLQSHRY